MPTKIRYNGEVIATVEPGKGKVLECSGMKMKSDIIVSAPAYQTKIISPSTETQIVSPDEGFEAFSKVTVEKTKLQEKTVTENGEVTPDEGYDGLSKVTVNAVSADSPLPIEVASEAEMNALLETAEVGSVYNYVGETGTYENGALYVVEEEVPNG
jgi:hypothetical protein